MRLYLPLIPLALLSFATRAFAQATPDHEGERWGFSQPEPQPSETSRQDGKDDPTGGAYTTPTLLFIPAAAVPAWTVRVITSLSMQGPTASDRLAVGSTSAQGFQALGFQPGLGAEVGLPLGITVAGGTQWVGGDPASTTATAPGGGALDGLSPYFQARLKLYGAESGRGFLLGTSVTYKFVGFQGDPGEMEWAVSAQYRKRRFELGLQSVLGKDFATTDADAEIHAYVLYRVVPELGVGLADQTRFSLVSQPGEPLVDVLGGAIASLTLGRWQVGGLGGVSTVGLNQGPVQGKVGGLGQAFATVRF